MSVATEQHRSATDSPYGAVHGAAGWRKRLRRELVRVGAADVALYVDGRRGTVRLRFADYGRQLHLGVRDALRLLRSLADGVGVEATVNALSGR